MESAIPRYYMKEEFYVSPEVVGPDGKKTASLEFDHAIRRTIDDSLVFRAPNAKEGLKLIRRLAITTDPKYVLGMPVR